jgi:hypothetical protein
MGCGASISRTLSAFPGVTAIAFRKLSHLEEYSMTESSLRFLRIFVRLSGERLRGLLQAIEPCFDSIYKFHPKILSSEIPLLQNGDLFRERFVSEHLEPVLKVTACKMELKGGNIDSVEDSKKIWETTRRSTCGGSESSIEVEGVLWRHASKNV